MEKENKSLSSKLFITNDKRLPVVLEKHVKEFIKDIKEISNDENVFRALTREDFIKRFNKKLDKLAGKDLIWV